MKGCAMIRTIQALAVTSLVAGILGGGLVANAQSDPAGHPPPAKEAKMDFSIPEPMQIEHEELHAALARLIKESGRTGEAAKAVAQVLEPRSEEHTSELQSLMRISYAVFCLKKKTNKNNY